MAHHGARMPAFRARNIDPNKRMYVYMENELDETVDATASRDITRLPTGMEKDEENESHIQEAINARQAYTLGEHRDQKIALIPTRPTEIIDTALYESLYKEVDGKLINKTEYLRLPLPYLFTNARNVYDADEEDYEWLSKKPHIKISDYEDIIGTLERESQDDICSQARADDLLVNMPDGVVGEVYDVWLNKKMECSKKGCNSLIPKLKTEVRKDGQNSSNPYICFRRRSERMQTRRNRKCEEENFEKMLYLKNNLRKFGFILETLQKREEIKLLILQQSENIFNLRISFDAEAQIMISRQNVSESVIRDRVTSSLTNVLEEYNDNTNVLVEKSNRYENIRKRKIRGRKPSSKTIDSEQEASDKQWLTNITKCFEAEEGSLDERRTNKRKVNGEGEGKFEFRRKRGVTYRAPNDIFIKPDNPNYEDLMYSRPEPNTHRDRFFPFTFASPLNGQSITRMVRKALGRCGQTFLEYINESDDDLPRSIYAVHRDTMYVDVNPSFRQNGCNGNYDYDYDSDY
uniref:Enhancer of polycomb-like protein n=1 Tax=Parastrongyloides trichosuri TaxID=131310 RepID=A0A0N4ZV10_PARTI